MATKYPSGIDDNLSLPRAIDLITPVSAEVVNDLRDTIIAIENELGINPSREFGNVSDRLDSITYLIGTGGAAGGNVAVQNEGSTVLTTAKTLNFIGANVNVTDAGSCQANIEINSDIQVVQETIIVNPLDVNTFKLSTTPSDADTVQMFVNGIKQKYGKDYTVSGNTVLFISPDLTMLTAFEVEFFYVVTGGIAYQESPIVSLNKTVFTLNNNPINGSVVQMYINGQKQQYGTDYTVTDITVTYSGSLVLSGTDDVEFWYISAAAVCNGQNGELFVKDEGVQVGGFIRYIDFVGAGVTVTSLTPNEVIVTIPSLTEPTFAEDGYIPIASNEDFTYIGGANVNDVLTWDGTQWISKSPNIVKFVHEEVSVDINGQTDFELSYEPADSYDGYDSVIMTLNQLVIHASDISISGSTVTYSGIPTTITTDVVTFYYPVSNLNGSSISPLPGTVTVVAASSPSLISKSNNYVFVDTSNASWSNGDDITLPAIIPVAGTKVFIKDIGGQALTKNIDVVGNGQTIDGAISYTLNTNYESLTLVSDGNNWSII